MIDGDLEKFFLSQSSTASSGEGGADHVSKEEY